MKSESLKKIGKHLQKKRQDAGFKSAKAFANYMGLNPNTYTDYEQGRISFSYEQAWQFADALNCTIDEIGGRIPPSQTRYQDPRQEKLNDSYESLNDDSKTEVSGMVASIATDPARRADSEQEDPS